VPKDTTDVKFSVTSQYAHRPDLLAYDLYQNVNLWWVFAVRNPDVLQDPVFDMAAGVQIYLPKLSNLRVSLGI
jgi:hypothetical protein